MSIPTPLKAQGPYWRTSWYDDEGVRRWKNFGSVMKVKKTDATAKYETWLQVFHTDEAVRNPNRTGLTVEALADQYQAHADTYYRRPDGKPTREATNIKHALGHATSVCGDLLATEFTPVKFREVRQAMIDRKLARRTINQRMTKIRRAFKWGVSHELVSANIWHALEAVEALKYGRTVAKETKAVKGAPVAHIEKVRPEVSAPVRAMIDLQLLTGMRPGEVRIMRGCDLDMNGASWRYLPEHHKTEHHGNERCIVLGPQAIAIVRPFLVHDLGRYLFRSTHHAATKPCYTRDSYYRAIARACTRAGVPRWSPGQLRHNFGTRMRKAYNLETAQVLLGHAKLETTQVYADRNLSQIREIMEAVG
ncbi:tyrosine-type recombinase/integrase [Phycisphaeraceae bacterium D3-23]